MDTTNDYNDEPDYDQMIAEDQWGCAGPGQLSDDDIEDHMREEYNAGDRAAKRHRLGPEPTDEAITNHANGNRANAGDIPARQWEYISVDGGIPKQVCTDILPSTEGHGTNGPQGKVHADDVSERSEPPVAPGETNGTVAAADDDADAGEAITNHANENRTNLSRNQQPTRMNTTTHRRPLCERRPHRGRAPYGGRIIALCAAMRHGQVDSYPRVPEAHGQSARHVRRVSSGSVNRWRHRLRAHTLPERRGDECTVRIDDRTLAQQVQQMV